MTKLNESDNCLERKKVKFKEPSIAALLNIPCPGLGYFYGGRFKLGLITAFIYPVLLVLIFFISVKLPEKINFFFFVISHLIITAFLVITAYKYSKKNKVKEGSNINIIFYILFWIFTYIFSLTIVKMNYNTYKSSSGSMSNTVNSKEYIIASKNYFGLVDPIFHTKLVSFDSPKRDQVVVYKFIEDNYGEYKETEYFKRIVAQPGDTIKIINKDCYINGVKEKYNSNYLFDNINRPSNFNNPRIYPKNSGWNEDNYGPLYIPRKDDIIKLDTSNIKKWAQLISSETDILFKNFDFDEYLKFGEYKIRNNYYFMIGDNRNNSLDSRFNGLVKEEDIEGKMEIIYWSIERARIGKKIE